MIYIWLGVGIVILFLVGNIVRWWNLPKVAEARRKQTEARTHQREAANKERTERLKIRGENRANRPGRGRRRRGNEPATQEIRK